MLAELGAGCAFFVGVALVAGQQAEVAEGSLEQAAPRDMTDLT